MNTWKLTGPKSLELVQEVEDLSLPNFAKVRITMVGVSHNEFELYRGNVENDSHITPGSLALGVISEIDEASSYLKKGDRVVISPYFACGNCFNCKSGNPKGCSALSCAGLTQDGFLKDFAIIPIDNLYPLPERISDKEAIFIPYIAEAINTLDKVNYDIGTFIGIGSGGILGNLIAQLAIYYQSIPILFDKNSLYLETAKKVGVYYAFSNDDTTLKKVMQVTSGKLVESMIYLCKSAMPVSSCFGFIKNGGSLVLAPVTSSENNFDSLPIDQILLHETTVVPANMSNNNFETSINLLATGKIEVLPLISGEVAFSDIPSFFESKLDSEANQSHFLYTVNI